MNAAVLPLQSNRKLILERLDGATLESLQRRLQGTEVHILHFVGHGGFDTHKQDGFLIFEDERGSQQTVTGRDLSVLLRNHPSIRLAVINACDGARSSSDDPFAGVAQTLVRQGLPAVIAMQFEISDQAAISFAHSFYGALADHYPVDAALVQARARIYVKSLGVEWGTPVLFMRAPDGHLFDLQDDEPKQPEEVLPRREQSAVNSTAARNRWVEKWRGYRKQIIALLLVCAALAVLVYIRTHPSSLKKSETPSTAPPTAAKSITRIFRFAKLPINLSIKPGGGYNYGFSSLEIDKGVQGEQVRLKRVQINLSARPHTPYACCDVWLLLGPRPFGFTPGAVIKGPNPFFINPASDIAPAQVHFVIGNGGNPLPIGQVVNFEASYDIESGAKNGNIDSLKEGFAPPLNLPDGLYAQVFMWNGNPGVDVDVESLSLIVDYVQADPKP